MKYGAVPKGAEWVSRGYFVNQMNDTGFGYLEVETNVEADSEVQAYHAGFLEGYLTSHLINARWFNMVYPVLLDNPESFKLAVNFVRSNSKWVSEKSKKLPNNPFWYQVKLFYLQVNGLLNGYLKTSTLLKLNWDHILVLNILLEIEDVMKMVTKSNSFNNEHCSALIKIMHNNSDIYFGHNTWTHYADMLRILKKYKLNYATSGSDPTLVPGREISMSSYPGAVLSTDDYYIVASSGIAVMETTNQVYNASLFKGSTPQGLVLESIRTMVANRLAVDGKSWHETFKKYNSGTYNNQWMVLDYNTFVPGTKLGPGVLWVGEQMPNFYHFEDVTEVMVRNGYWASYNVPYFKEVFEMSGYDEMKRKNGTWFSHSETPRAKIFARDHGKVTDMDTFMKLLRSNDYRNDPYATCNCTPPYSAAGAVAGRNDLNPYDGKGPQATHRLYGAIDAKITNLSMFRRYAFSSVAGPTRGTNDDLPVFKWSASGYDPYSIHFMQPDEFDFAAVTTEWLFSDDNGFNRKLNNQAKQKHLFPGYDNTIPKMGLPSL
ncbi:putative phospholipase B-like 2 [Nilaparvata lugens]|uniref:putative phospholipase B-like 2 n=1 Tax=Nilaparvata lugens TaxID=108931 RepID=UPI00193D9490|nr:putative phospholipase B-like 2 [Nilaparvata lugens]XP_039283630.1 putative phospholipase B-like 2 [Nilaparvata lugens]XP_039283632.1 putative phospholipase B-like 2 [Nilaparvata lugens]